ncbi:MAG: universal stress protein [Chloroflexi bacterium]|nr:universal stress protein [Chloroflexota bacterium]MDA1297757.1 universal stress protein [Chloroflexota bacterium]
MAEKILVPLDRSEYAEQVVPFVGEFAKAGGFQVTLLSIIDPEDLDITETAGEGELAARDTGTSDGGTGMNMAHRGTGGITGMAWMAPIGSPSDLSADEAGALDEANRSTTEYLLSVEKKLEKMGVQTETRLGFGNADIEIAEEAIKSGATMIAMSARSNMFWERGMLGSTTNRVIAASPMPVIVFKPMEGLAKAVSVNPDTIVIAVDGSAESEACVDPAVKLAGKIGAKVALVHVLSRDRGRRREHAESYLKQLKERIGGEVETSVAAGHVDDEVILYADQFDHPMIAVAEHGGISVRRWLRGSATDKIIRNAGYPVLVIPNAN